MFKQVIFNLMTSNSGTFEKRLAKNAGRAMRKGWGWARACIAVAHAMTHFSSSSHHPATCAA
jgi:hypothetical protein